MIHQLKLQPRPFDQIKAGKKIIESRLFDEKRQQIQLGDIIEFRREPDLTGSVRAKVIALLRYQTFSELMNDFPSEYFGSNSKQELLKEIYSFYTKQEEQKYSVLGIRVIKLNSS